EHARRETPSQTFVERVLLLLESDADFEDDAQEEVKTARLQVGRLVRSDANRLLLPRREQVDAVLAAEVLDAELAAHVVDARVEVRNHRVNDGAVVQRVSPDADGQRGEPAPSELDRSGVQYEHERHGEIVPAARAQRPHPRMLPARAVRL